MVCFQTPAEQFIMFFLCCQWDNMWFLWQHIIVSWIFYQCCSFQCCVLYLSSVHVWLMIRCSDVYDSSLTVNFAVSSLNHSGLQVLDICQLCFQNVRLRLLTEDLNKKIVPEITYYVLSGTLSLYQGLTYCFVAVYKSQASTLLLLWRVGWLCQL